MMDNEAAAEAAAVDNDIAVADAPQEHYMDTENNDYNYTVMEEAVVVD